jgi:hypothetical protein
MSADMNTDLVNAPVLEEVAHQHHPCPLLIVIVGNPGVGKRTAALHIQSRHGYTWYPYRGRHKDCLFGFQLPTVITIQIDDFVWSLIPDGAYVINLIRDDIVTNESAHSIVTNNGTIRSLQQELTAVINSIPEDYDD